MFQWFKKIASSKREKSQIPHKRDIAMEPLEERLPVSSSAAGVLLGCGLLGGGDDTQQTVVASSQETFSYRVENSNLALDFDAFHEVNLDTFVPQAVDEVFSGSTTSSDSDVWELTPLDTSSLLDDVEQADSIQSFDDQLLLELASVSNFGGSFQADVVYHDITSLSNSGGASSGNAVTSQEQTAKPSDYGFSLIADDLQNEDEGGVMTMSCGCGNYNYSHVNYASLRGGGSCSSQNAVIYNANCTPNTQPISKTLYLLQSNGSVGLTAGSTGCNTQVYVKNDDGNWTSSACGTYWTWTKPTGVADKDVEQRDYTFTFYSDANGNATHDSDEDFVDLNVHIGWAEVRVAFAGRGNYHPVNAKAGDTKTLDNTLIVGQELAAIPYYDSQFYADIESVRWSDPVGGSSVRNYITDVNKGEIVSLTNEHKTSYTFRSYYYNKTADIGSISASYTLVDPNGVRHSVTGSASYFLETATVEKFTATKTTRNPAVGIYSITGCIGIGFGYVSRFVSPGITWEMSVISNYGGKFGLYQIVTSTERQIKYYNIDNINAPHSRYWKNTNNMLDGGPNLGIFYANQLWDVNPQTPQKTDDSPAIGSYSNLVGFIGAHDEFRTTLMYLPPGEKVIPVALQAMEWNWWGEMVKPNFVAPAISPGSWNIARNTSHIGNTFVTSALPTWTGNTDVFLVNPTKIIGNPPFLQ